MANYNIEMNYYNGNSYDILQPKTILNNISDWQNSIYSKTEIDSKISIIQQELDSFTPTSNNYITSTRITITESLHKVALHKNFSEYKIIAVNLSFPGSVPTGYIDLNSSGNIWFSSNERLEEASFLFAKIASTRFLVIGNTKGDVGGNSVQYNNGTSSIISISDNNLRIYASTEKGAVLTTTLRVEVYGY